MWYDKAKNRITATLFYPCSNSATAEQLRAEGIRLAAICPGMVGEERRYWVYASLESARQAHPYAVILECEVPALYLKTAESEPPRTQRDPMRGTYRILPARKLALRRDIPAACIRAAHTPLRQETETLRPATFCTDDLPLLEKTYAALNRIYRLAGQMDAHILELYRDDAAQEQAWSDFYRSMPGLSQWVTARRFKVASPERQARLEAFLRDWRGEVAELETQVRSGVATRPEIGAQEALASFCEAQEVVSAVLREGTAGQRESAYRLGEAAQAASAAVTALADQLEGILHFYGSPEEIAHRGERRSGQLTYPSVRKWVEELLGREPETQ